METSKEYLTESREQQITRMAREHGFDLTAPLFTMDGDEVRVVGFDKVNLFLGWPIIGEIIETTVAFDGLKTQSRRLARFDLQGAIDAKTERAVRKHSLAKNKIVRPANLPVHDEPSFGMKTEKAWLDEYELIKTIWSSVIPQAMVLELDNINFSWPTTLPAKDKVKITHLKLPEPMYLDRGTTLTIYNARTLEIK